jgi:hypothetical protein
MGLEDIRDALLSASSGKEVIQTIWNLNQELQFKVIILLWRWWFARNKANAGDQMASPGEVCSLVTYFLMEFKKLANQQKQEKQKIQMKWKAPPADYYKLNIDASFDPKTRSGGWGYIARNSEGDFLDGGAGNIMCPMPFKLKLLLHCRPCRGQLNLACRVLSWKRMQLIWAKH